MSELSPVPASAVAIGNFDGVHLGHQELIRQLVQFASERKVVPAVLTFDPHPTAVVAPDRVPPMICSVKERVTRLKELGVREVQILPFTAELAALSPREFVQQYLVNGLRAVGIFVGENFRFGYKKSGDCSTLKALGEEFGFAPHCLSAVRFRGSVVSSTAIRRCLESGNVTLANRLLGRCFSITGPVVAGHGIGSKQTVPTLNLRPMPNGITPRGAYVTETIDLPTARRWQSITNAGIRPTFNGHEVTIETFLLSPFEAPTPRQIRVEFRRFVRAERQFPTAEDLKAQIMRDVGRAKAYWQHIGRLSTAPSSIY